MRSNPFKFPDKIYKYRFSCWTGTGFVYMALSKLERLSYYCYIGPPAYADYVYVETNGETREAALKELNEILHKNGAGPGDYLHLIFH